ncbi:NAD-dependent protein deacylase [Nisaea acidiphila]|uniref:NAD-dependent protein deacylase n=1 Tax=Nisaea acidiphila TaxID=1862145 RepID=A0A9J7AL66_9PROT|nr:Sir2 family NAD+-dependent deacetylase [Nisaea acidiphila]UUX48224.1 NAD-dependent protein deacylase [Nisaea acidiphila]
MQLNLSPEASIVILTGAGISKESGLDTFRDADGIWSKVNLEDVATPEGYRRNPVMVHEFYNARRRSLLNANVTPNAAHAALAKLEKEWPGTVLLVTQNIDDLHERAGSSNLLHMHGEMLKVRCERTGEIFEWREDLGLESRSPTTNEAGTLRPHVVWFGEMPLYMEEIYEALSDADLFISIGTSGNVYPAAGFVQEARMHGAHTIELNLEPSEGATLFAEKRYGPASEIVPDYVEELLGAC